MPHGAPTAGHVKWPTYTFPLLIPAPTHAYAGDRGKADFGSCPSGVTRLPWRAAAIDIVKSPTCRSCSAPLPRRDARCPVCGWAVDYDPERSRRERELVLGVSLTVVSIILAIAIAITFAYIKQHL